MGNQTVVYDRSDKISNLEFYVSVIIDENSVITNDVGKYESSYKICNKKTKKAIAYYPKNKNTFLTGPYVINESPYYVRNVAKIVYVSRKD